MHEIHHLIPPLNQLFLTTFASCPLNSRPQLIALKAPRRSLENREENDQRMNPHLIRPQADRQTDNG